MSDTADKARPHSYALYSSSTIITTTTTTTRRHRTRWRQRSPRCWKGKLRVIELSNHGFGVGRGARVKVCCGEVRTAPVCSEWKVWAPSMPTLTHYENPPEGEALKRHGAAFASSSHTSASEKVVPLCRSTTMRSVSRPLVRSSRPSSESIHLALATRADPSSSPPHSMCMLWQGMPTRNNVLFIIHHASLP